jgi:hypothetical protein
VSAALLFLVLIMMIVLLLDIEFLDIRLILIPGHLKFIMDAYFEYTFSTVFIYFVRVKNMKRKERYIKKRHSK